MQSVRSVMSCLLFVSCVFSVKPFAELAEMLSDIECGRCVLSLSRPAAWLHSTAKKPSGPSRISQSRDITSFVPSSPSHLNLTASTSPFISMASTEAAAEEPQAVAPPPQEVLYCPHCTFPPEYCSFGSSASKCRAWLVAEHPDLAEKIYGSSSGGDGADGAAATEGGAKKGGAAKGKKGKAADGEDEEPDVDGTAKQVEEGLTLKQQEDEAKEREKKERREDKKREKEAKERKVSWCQLHRSSFSSSSFNE